MTANEEQKIRARQALMEANPIQVSVRVAESLFPKVNPMIFRDTLQRAINFSTYGDGIVKFYFTFIAMKNTVLKFEGIYYSRKKRHLEVAVRIPFEKVQEATQAETIHLMEKAFLEGIDLIATKKLVAPFDHEAFKRDVETIFEQEYWYEEDLKKYQEKLRG